ncbi:MAG: biopolymer transporter ExbD [Gammaproteobacteria bacterium]|nr:biopolymer transporter ExbD [Gammaproteobacteria bacterium]
MSVGGNGGAPNSAPMSEINTTPLVDVMLVLLIIFMITAPLITHKIPIDLPQASTVKEEAKPKIVTLAITFDGVMYWDDNAVTQEEWEARIANAALEVPQPELQLRADKNTRYEKLAQVMADAQNAGIVKLGFITGPDADPDATTAQ